MMFLSCLSGCYSTNSEQGVAGLLATRAAFRAVLRRGHEAELELGERGAGATSGNDFTAGGQSCAR